jgi:pyruvate formate lyase activating enzyme
MIKNGTLYVDPLFEDAARLIVKEQRGGTALLQSNYQIGYNRAGVMMDELEQAGIVSQAYGSKPRDVLIHDETSLKKHLNSLNYMMVPEYIHKTRVLGISRLRMGTDGHGITALVAFQGCSLRCNYCLNPDSLKDSEKVKRMLPEEVMEEVRKDELYYIATNGGITFGGGEPLLNSQYIKDILELGAKEWNVTVETSLNVPRSHLELLLPYIDEYIVDIKDMNTQIYESYTGKGNSQVKENLKWLVEQGMAERILCRIPLIPNYNNASDQENSKKELSEMGITRFEMFNYIITKECCKSKNTFLEKIKSGEIKVFTGKLTY